MQFSPGATSGSALAGSLRVGYGLAWLRFFRRHSRFALLALAFPVCFVWRSGSIFPFILRCCGGGEKVRRSVAPFRTDRAAAPMIRRGKKGSRRGVCRKAEAYVVRTAAWQKRITRRPSFASFAPAWSCVVRGKKC